MGRKKEKGKVNPKGLIRAYKVFGRHYKPYWKVLTLAYSSLFIAIAAAVLKPWPLKLILDHLILRRPLPASFAWMNEAVTNRPQQLLLILAASIVVIAILEAVFSYFNKFWVSSTGFRIIADIRERVFAHLQRLSLSFHDSARSGNLIYLLTADVKEMKDILIDFPQDFTERVVTFGAYASLMLALDWRLGLIAMCTVPLFVIFTRYFGKGMKKAMKKRRELEGEVSSTIAENVTAMAVVQAYGREDSERARFNVENKGSLEAQLQALRLHKTYSRITDFLVITSTAGVLYFGGHYAFNSEILPGTLVLFVTYMKDIYGSVEKFAAMFIGLAKSQASSDRLLALVENDMVTQDEPGAKPAPPLKGHIEFRNVSFAYKDGKEVLKNLDFEVRAGETVALIGHSGAGKSTLISLLLRFYNPKQGEILIDGQDIRQFTLKSLRDQLTIVMQDAKLFRQSVRENIAFGKRGATDEEIVEAAKLAEAHDFIMEMPEDYETVMSEGGENLSGGQKQRINIARAIIRNTPIVILDEPTTGLDVKTEAKVSEAIHRLTRGKTTFIIAHRFSTVANADKILLLEEGKLAHFGTHEQLMQDSREYRELYGLQTDHRSRAVGVEATADTSNDSVGSGAVDVSYSEA